MANLEALWMAGRLRPGEKVLASRQAHYTHERIGRVLGLDFELGAVAVVRVGAFALEPPAHDRERRQGVVGGPGVVVERERA